MRPVIIPNISDDNKERMRKSNLTRKRCLNRKKCKLFKENIRLLQLYICSTRIGQRISVTIWKENKRTQKRQVFTLHTSPTEMRSNKAEKALAEGKSIKREVVVSVENKFDLSIQGLS